MEETDTTRQTFAARYEEGRVPWGDPAPPPEIVALAVATPPGRALDVGCGYGRAVIHLAERGWSAVGVDFELGAGEGRTAGSVLCRSALARD